VTWTERAGYFELEQLVQVSTNSLDGRVLSD
jgi:hypothetical protein